MVLSQSSNLVPSQEADLTPALGLQAGENNNGRTTSETNLLLVLGDARDALNNAITALAASASTGALGSETSSAPIYPGTRVGGSSTVNGVTVYTAESGRKWCVPLVTDHLRPHQLPPFMGSRGPPAPRCCGVSYRCQWQLLTRNAQNERVNDWDIHLSSQDPNLPMVVDCDKYFSSIELIPTMDTRMPSTITDNITSIVDNANVGTQLEQNLVSNNARCFGLFPSLIASRYQHYVVSDIKITRR
jgi:hypothetical protein